MVTLKEFNYQEIKQRKIILLNSFLSYTLFSYILLEIALSFKKYFLYKSIPGIIFICFCFAHLCGNLPGKLIFSKIKKTRAVFLTVEVLLFVFSLLFIGKQMIFPLQGELYLHFFFNDNFLYRAMFLALISIPAILIGFKHSYYLKVLTGTFFDEKKGIMQYILLSACGALTGILLALYSFYDTNIHFNTAWIHPLAVAIIPAGIFISGLFIKLAYSPRTFIAHEIQEEKKEKQSKREFREDIVFSLLNFPYVIIYLFLGLLSIYKFHGTLLKYKLTFIIITTLFIIAGHVFSRIFKKAVWHIYSEMLYPFLFLVFLINLFIFGSTMSILQSVLSFAPLCFIFGSTLHHTISYISKKYDQKFSLKIFDLSIFILPIPILLILNTLDFSNRLFFIVFYTIALLNFTLPGIHLFIVKKNRDIKKVIYLVFVFTITPLFILSHIFIDDISFNDNKFVNPVKNENALKTINFNNFYISRKISINYNREKLFSISNSSYQSLHKSFSLIPFLSSKRNDNFLFIDGNLFFYHNNLYQYFQNSTVLNYFPIKRSRSIFTRLSKYPGIITGSLVETLYPAKNKYEIIMDYPNIYDQQNDPFRFSESFYNIIGKNLEEKGFYIQLINLKECHNGFITDAIINSENSFKKSYFFIFTNQLAIVSTNSNERSTFNETNLTRLRQFLKNQHMNYIFYDDIQLFSHLIFHNSSDLLKYIENSEKIFQPFNLLSFSDNRDFNIYDNKDFKELYVSSNDKLLENFDGSSIAYRGLSKKIKSEKNILRLLKLVDVAESNELYGEETLNSFKLKELGKRNSRLRKYITPLVDFKFKHYFKTALDLETKKQWDKAQDIYKAILNVNSNNFEANYRMGILLLTLQKLDSAFSYLDKAMYLKPNHPDTLYQMGVLQFASGNPRKALVHLKRALAYKNNDSSTQYYIGLCNEQLGRLRDARSAYKRALQRDPNNHDIINAMKRIKAAIKAEQARWSAPIRKNEKEAEQGETIDLPINKSAFDKRLEDLPPEEAKNYRKGQQ